MVGSIDYDDLPEDIRDYVQEISNEIYSCEDCQPYDKEIGTVWVYGTEYDIEDLLSEYGIPEELWDDIIPYLNCPMCGCELHRYSKIGVMSEYEAEYNSKYDEIVEETKDKIQSFYDFLAKYPYLGLGHEVGQEINKEIEKMPLITIENKLFYRARKPDNGKIFCHEDMLNPPQTIKIPEGRFNHFGQSHLYLGDSEELCAIEIGDKDKELIWLQKYKIKRLLNVLDVTVFINEDNIYQIPLFFSGLFISRHINLQKSNDISWTPEYFIPRFIADIARHNNINGIIYSSTKTIGRNLVIFDLKKCEYKLDGDPYIFTFDKKLYEPKF